VDGGTAHAQASPFRDRRVDGGAGLDGGVARTRGGAREGAGCLTGRSIAGRADYAGETSEHAFHAREGAGKRERLAVTLRPRGWPEVRVPVR
jgi:hypothetical protein